MNPLTVQIEPTSSSEWSNGGFSLATLKLAFGVDIARAIMCADGPLTRHKFAFLQHHFPDHDLTAQGFIDPSGQFTAQHHRAVEIACTTLSGAMSAGEKSAYLSLFIEASLVAGRYDSRAGRVLAACGQVLGIGSAELERLAAAMAVAAGRVRFVEEPDGGEVGALGPFGARAAERGRRRVATAVWGAESPRAELTAGPVAVSTA
jgi:hypothetical protein